MDDLIKTSADALENDVLPRMREVHANQAGKDGDVPEKLREAAKDKSPAQWAYERLIMYIKKFEETLDSDHEVAMGFTGGDAGILKIEGIGFFDPDIVTFFGIDPEGGRTQLVQHVTQLNVLLRALPKEVEAEPPRRIGFQLAKELDEAAR